MSGTTISKMNTSSSQAQGPMPDKDLRHDVLCFSSIDWDFMWQGHQEIMSSLARAGHRVLFIENTGVRAPGLKDLGRIRSRIMNWRKGLQGYRKVSENLFVCSPLIFPFPYSRLARWINRLIIFSSLKKWMRTMDFYAPVCWAFLPTPLTLEILQRIPRKLLIYYCIDSFVNSTVAAKRVSKSEQDLFSEADLCFVTSRKLYEMAAKKNKQVYFFPFGVSIEKFDRERVAPRGCPSEFQGMKKPIVGYVGGIHQWVDQDLLVGVARRRPDISFVFVGPEQTHAERLNREPNIHLLGQRGHDELPCYIRHFDAAIIPYRLTEYTRNVYPTKLNEYHALMKPVVSTPLPEVIDFNKKYGGLVSIGSDVTGFSQALQKALESDQKEMGEERLAAARDNAWSRRIEKMQEIICGALLEKETQSDENWVLRFATALQTSQVLKRAAVALVIITGILFYTPAARIAANPLRTTGHAVPSNAIVVFGGGVGESGRAGERYRSQVTKAVQLYRQGYAPRILFISGYRNVFSETDIMLLLTESLGVPREALLTEPYVKNTFEYVQKVVEIARKESWSSVILLTTPYHGRRATLTFHKHIPELAVHVTTESQSFSDLEWKTRPSEIYRVAHEYAALVYYWWKGWI